MFNRKTLLRVHTIVPSSLRDSARRRAQKDINNVSMNKVDSFNIAVHSRKYRVTEVQIAFCLQYQVTSAPSCVYRDALA